MIFVSVGSGDFDPLIKAMDQICEDDDDLQVTMQIGLGKYLPKNGDYFRFAPSLAPYYDKANLVIAHGGVGVTLEVLRRGLPLIGVENRPDHHQVDLLSHLSEKGYLVWCRDLQRLGEVIDSMPERVLNEWVPEPCIVHLYVEEYLRRLLQKQAP